LDSIVDFVGKSPSEATVNLNYGVNRASKPKRAVANWDMNGIVDSTRLNVYINEIDVSKDGVYG